MTGWNLPPGVTEKMIDDAFGGRDVCDPCDEGEHGDCEGKLCECEECRENDRYDYEEEMGMERYYENKYGSGDPEGDYLAMHEGEDC